MPAVRHCGRVDTFELKIQMERRLGSQKSESYFNLLTRYLSLKLGKSEFDKRCICLIGRENISLHNELIRGILKNATVSNTPPPKQVKHDSLLTIKESNGGLQSICRDVFPPSPRKGRTPNLRERKFKDRPSPLGLSEKNHRRIPITAPFGVDIHSKDTRKVARNDPCSSFRTETCGYTGQLQSTSSLENRLKQTNKTEGLDISVDCVNQLNKGVDSYLKRLIKASLELASSRSLHQPGKRLTLLDFQMAAMCSPAILGEDWPVQLQKICFENE